MKIKLLVSACLLGIKCRYDGRSKPKQRIISLLKSKKIRVIPICPEQLGGMMTPRPRAGIYGLGDGHNVLQGKTIVVNSKGEDVSNNFIRGAKEALKIAKLTSTTKFISKAKSPSCGLGMTTKSKLSKSGKFIIYKEKGDGVTVALLKKNGIKVVTEERYQ